MNKINKKKTVFFHKPASKFIIEVYMKIYDSGNDGPVSKD